MTCWIARSNSPWKPSNSGRAYRKTKRAEYSAVNFSVRPHRLEQTTRPQLERSPKPTSSPKWAPFWRKLTNQAIGSSCYLMPEKWTTPRLPRCDRRPTNLSRLLFPQSTPHEKKRKPNEEYIVSSAYLWGPEGFEFCILNSAFCIPPPCHFNKEQTPLAILRYQPTVSRWFFRCLGAHLLRSPRIVKSGLNHPARIYCERPSSGPAENLGSPAPLYVFGLVTSSRCRLRCVSQCYTFRS